ncbi:putative stress-associated endoplasmic reticulum protein [Medicago truncatula]|uniref:Putative stress-associated endoplasmic reticulum protein n=1 Tax=Medicago truncatula TaxID=3880 RepID=A0A396J436_MEDTR|nr:putative stress-associated endoplasmic reticulum protein [Medicago truncatula]
MTTSRRVADRKVARFERSITKKAKKGFKFPTGPVLIGCFVFIIVGSCLFQIIRLAQRSGNVA